MPHRDRRHDTELPDWFSPAFAHLDEADRRRVITLWQNEPVLRELAARLDKFRQPETLRCALCHSTRVYHVNPSAPEKLHCKSCHRNSSLYHGTPFSGLMHALHHRLYAILLTLWGCWRKEEAVWLSHCINKTTWDQYIVRLTPLLRQVSGRSVTAVPRYVLGFLPGELGLHCPHCDSAWLNWGEAAPADNPLIHCEDCHRTFLMHDVTGSPVGSPTVPDTFSPVPANRGRDMAVPAWFRREFAHVTPGQYQHLREVWLREPLLREVAGELDAQNPLMGGVHACVRCGSTGLSQYHTPGVVTTYYYCAACKSRFSEAEGTVFYKIPRHFWYRLYTVLVCLWTSWKQAQSLSVCQIGSNCGITPYRKRLRPLIDACRGDNPVTPRPRKMLGFSPAEQGVSCISCTSGHLVMEGVTKISPDNPLVVCRDCGARFRLQEWLQARDAR
ncbi:MULTISPECIES: hypothetical protein [Enterobacter]|uniref:hypothetical protein n=1 Tax=Enterobacter TaxID=547 RepID=UPI001CBDAFD5|nr:MULTISPECIES: hypothetical protein [Enterobacter]MCG7803908.1 hypothetical protein [Enterobacter asburiae]UAN18780.1 hypothetical protein KGP20_24120 [Enterobacter asburiae]UAN34191.1 hypothetical protein KGP22_22485 [Enterobacter sp. JBIWA005]UKU10009.1 hypothetical protein [Enterobacter asburiae]